VGRRWGELVDDEILGTFAVTGEPEEIPAKMLDRYGDVVDRISFYAPYKSDRERWARVVEGFQNRELSLTRPNVCSYSGWRFPGRCRFPRGKRVRAGARQPRADLSRVDPPARSMRRVPWSSSTTPPALSGCARRSRLAWRAGSRETKVWRDSGHRSAAHWVAEETGETVGAASRALETARALEHLPDTDAAFRAGELSGTQAAEIAGAAGADPDAERELLETAAETSVKGLRDRCRQVRAGAEADDRAWARRLHVERKAHEWTDPDGAYRIEARLAPDAGARFSSAWKAHVDRIFCEARRAGRREPRAAYAADAL